MYNHIIFDIDGTLLDSQRTGLYSLQKTILDLLGRKTNIDDLYRYFGIPSRQAVIEIGFPDPEEASKVWEENFQSMVDLIVPFDGVEEMIVALNNSGKRLGIVTSRNREELFEDPKMKSLLPYFDIAICSEDSIKHKPYPDPVLTYLKKSGANPSESLYVGDTIYDCLCGKDAGVDFALISHNKGIEEIDPNIKADYIVFSAAELTNLILKQRKER